MKDVNELAQRIYEQNKKVGWWDDSNRCILTCFQLVSTEIAEATEGERKDLMDDHLPTRKMGEVELADALVRVLDLGAHLGLQYWHMYSNKPGCPPYELERWFHTNTPGAYHLGLNKALIELAECYLLQSQGPNKLYTHLVDSIMWVSDQLGYDIWNAMDEKIAYNLTRADHQRENRADTNGKKF